MFGKRLFIENSTINDILNLSVKKYRKEIFLAYPRTNYFNQNKYYTYEDVFKLSQKFIKYFQLLNLQYGDRVSIIVGNIPEFFILKLSLNCMGVSSVPINYELRQSEIKYILEHSKSNLVICTNDYIDNIKKIVKSCRKNIGILLFRNNDFIKINKFKVKNIKKKIKNSPITEASLLYTSGTTGKPKACILSHFYEINAGYSYILKKGLISIRPKRERIYNCLPVHHVNAGVFSFFAALISGNCQIQAKRFSASSFWKEIKYSKATIFHYLGVMVPILLKKKKTNIEKQNNLKVGIGAGIEPNFHKTFEDRFNVPMIELWGMTEMVRCIFDFKENRKIGQRCFGKPDKSLEVKVIDKSGKSLIDEEGELLIRHNEKNPKKGFFDGYFNDKRATNNVWKNNWFYTGDIVKKDKNGYLFFVDRKKNIIRRSGENISSAEVEASILSLSQIRNVAVCAYPHEIYDEEVLAFIILKNKENESLIFAKKTLLSLSKKITYFKLPAYIQFTDNLPVTSTQKIRKTDLIKKISMEKKSKFYDLCDYKKSFKIN